MLFSCATWGFEIAELAFVHTSCYFMLCALVCSTPLLFAGLPTEVDSWLLALVTNAVLLVSGW